jgi:hypothetical protein
MIDTDKYMYEEEAKKIVQDAGLIDECDGFLDVHYKSIAHLLAEVNRAYQLIVQASWLIHWAESLLASLMEAKEWDESIHAPAQGWRKRVQYILDASEEGCPWRETE